MIATYEIRLLVKNYETRENKQDLVNLLLVNRCVIKRYMTRRRRQRRSSGATAALTVEFVANQRLGLMLFSEFFNNILNSFKLRRPHEVKFPSKKHEMFEGCV